MRIIQSVLLFTIAFASLKPSVGQNTGTIQLVGKLPITDLPIHDVWGYIDTVTGNQYALLGASNSGLRVIDVTDATDPQLVGTLSGGGVQAIDVKTWLNYAYVVGENINAPGRVIDLTDPADPQVVGTFPGAHNIAITEDGFMYLAAPGVRIFNLNTDPLNPELVYSDITCDGHDISIIDDRLFDFSDNCGTRIFDVSDPDTLVSLGAVPSNGMFHHSGWPTEDGDHVFVLDELASPTEKDITVWDISNVQDPFLVDSFSDPDAYVHNIYVHGDYAFVSYYRAGFRVFDVADPTNISLIAEYDTDSTASGPGYGGNFGLYTFWGTDKILASDEENGLYIFSFQVTTGIEDRNSTIKEFSVYPNPVNGNSTLEYSLGRQSKVEIGTYNLQGQLINSIDEGVMNEGTHRANLPTADLVQGLYFVRVRTGTTEKTMRMIVAND
jgi:choice-of-anchor B domain-containing protein